MKETKGIRGLTRREALKRGVWAGLGAGLSGSLWIGGCGRKKRLERMPNIFLITADTLRADYLGCYGYRKQTSPNIDRFAKEAMLFERCFSHAPETRSSFASMLSGFLPHEHKVLENQVLGDKVELISEILRGYGYRTAAVISNYVLRRGEGFEQGFEVFDDTMKQRELVRQVPERIAADATTRAIELVKESGPRPTFMWIHYQDPHGPYTPPAGFAEQFYEQAGQKRLLKFNDSLTGRGGIPAHQRLGDNRDYYYYVSQYDGEIRYMDEHIGRLLNALGETGRYDETLIIFTSDHGEGMGEHDYYFAHIDYLYNTLTHVPLIIKYGEEFLGRRDDYVQHLDLVPTILRLVGAELNRRYRGCDLRKKAEADSEIFAAMRSPLVRDSIKYSVIKDFFKLIYTPVDESYELYDMRGDFGEQNNLAGAAEYADRLGRLKGGLVRTLKEDFVKVGQVKKRRELSEQEKQNLRSLGYVE